VLYNYFELWFMPLLCFLSGMGAQKELTRQRAARLLSHVVGPAMLVYATTLYNQSPINPNGHLWYLWALLCWRLVAPLLLVMSDPLVLLCTAGISVLGPGLFKPESPIWGGGRDANPFALKQVISFFFFFGLGLVIKQAHIEHALCLSWLRPCSLVVSFLFLGLVSGDHVAILLDAHVADFQEFRQSLSSREAHPDCPWLPRAISLVVTSVVGAAALFSMPSTETIWTVAGTRTIYPYVLHVAVAAPLSRLDLIPELPHENLVLGALVWMPMLLLVPLLIAYLLTTFPVRLIFWPLLEPTWVHVCLLRRELQLAPIRDQRVSLAVDRVACEQHQRVSLAVDRESLTDSCSMPLVASPAPRSLRARLRGALASRLTVLEHSTTCLAPADLALHSPSRWARWIALELTFVIAHHYTCGGHGQREALVTMGLLVGAAGHEVVRALFAIRAIWEHARIQADARNAKVASHI